MPKEREIVLTKTTLKAAKSDLAYWRSQPYEARLAALESIRSESFPGFMHPHHKPSILVL